MAGRDFQLQTWDQAAEYIEDLAKQLELLGEPTQAKEIRAVLNRIAACRKGESWLEPETMGEEFVSPVFRELLRIGVA